MTIEKRFLVGLWGLLDCSFGLGSMRCQAVVHSFFVESDTMRGELHVWFAMAVLGLKVKFS